MTIRLRFATLAALTGVLFLQGCNDDGGPPAATAVPTRYVQTWGTAGAFATTAAVSPYFPSIANQTTGITAPGVAVSPALTPPTGTSTTAAIFANATVRQFFKVSIDGTTVRLRLSNAFSPGDLTIDELHVALADRAACQPAAVPVAPATAARGPTCTNIVAATDRTVTVNGSTRFVIPRGQDLYTDPVALTVGPLADVAVSFYVRDPTPALTTHSLGAATAYYAVGLPGSTANYTAATALDTRTIGGQAALATSTSIVVATGIDVQAPQTTRAIVAFGDSITDGTNTVVDTSTRWSNLLAARFRDQSLASGTPRVAVSNAGISGNKVATDNATVSFGIAGVTRFRRDVLDRSGVTDVIVLEGINDIGQPATPASSDAIIAAYRNLIQQAHAANVRIYFATITPIRTDTATAAGTFGGLFTPTAAAFDLREPVRLAVNAWILSQTEADGVFDFNAAVSAPGRLNQLLAQNSVSLTNGSNDQLHPNAIGYQLMANAVDLARFR